MDREDRAKVLKFEQIWRDEFLEQKNPFIAYLWWISEEQRQRRRCIYEYYGKGNNNGKELL